MNNFNYLLRFDSLSQLMITLIGLVSFVVLIFSLRYLRGDTMQGSFFRKLITLAASTMIMVCADHLIVLFVFWGLSNFLLVRMMLHKGAWSASRASAILAYRNFGLGQGALGVALFLLYAQTGEFSLNSILVNLPDSPLTTVSGLLLILCAFTQSAIWPFHKWLLSSLNSPTPVSALMHAGLVNGGGFLLARFAPLLFENAVLLDVILVSGLLTTMIATFWMLIQADVKRMLACSTASQMGFMMLQVGLGLFPAAIAHLCWHGFFKAHLFLSSGSVVSEKVSSGRDTPSLLQLSGAFCYGLIATIIFSYISGYELFPLNSSLVLSVVALLAGSQLALSILTSHIPGKHLLTPVGVLTTSFLYGCSVASIELWLESMNMGQAQPFSFFHLLTISAFVCGWLGLIFREVLPVSSNYRARLYALYVRQLNASQPHPKSVTAYRNHYTF